VKISAFIPYWQEYSSSLNDLCDYRQNILCGKHLLNYTIEILSDVSSLSSIDVFASNQNVCSLINTDLKYNFIQRSETLDSISVSIEDIIKAYLSVSDADIVVLLHPNSPFLAPATVECCIQAVATGEYDSAFTAYCIRQLAWFDGEPLNYSRDEVTPAKKDIQPVVIEQSSLYVFSRDCFNTHKKRIGLTPFIKYIDHVEGHGVITEDDYRMAELIINSGMYSKL
jgi:CMP-N-acetylneuraminic acid synthetase